MFSKTGLKIILAGVAAAGVLSGCDAKVGEQPPPATSYEFNGTQCLTDVLPKITDFLDGKTTDNDVVNTWDCFSTALEKFKKYVRGSSADRYTPQELSTFLQDNFFNPDDQGKKVITPQLQAEVMKFKQIFLGGSSEYLTMNDLDEAIQLFQTLKGMTLKVNPYMKVFALNWSVSQTNNVQADTKYFEDANLAIQNLAKDLAALVQKNHPAYVLSDFVVFSRELNKLYDEPWPFLSKVEQFMPVVQKIKKAIAGGDETAVAPDEWKSFLLLGARGYVQYLRYYYFISSAPETGTSIRLSYVARELEDGISVFQDLVAVKPSGIVSRDEIYDLLKTVSSAWPEFKVSDNLIFEFMKLKQLLIGGSIDSFTTTDFSTARLKVSRLKALVERFLPYYDIYGMNWDPGSLPDPDAQKFFTDSQFNLEATAQELGSLFETSYDLNDAYSLVHELVFLYPDKFSGDSSMDSVVQKYLPLVTDVKNMVYGENDTVVKKAQWSSFLRFVARGYSDFLYADYFFKPNSLSSAKGLSAAGVLLNQTINIFRDLLAANANASFSQADLSHFAQHVVATGLLPAALDSNVINIVLDKVLNRVLLPPDQRLEGKRPAALTTQSLEVLRFEAQVWLEMENFFVGLFPTGQETYSQSRIEQIFIDKYKVPGLSKELNTGLKEMIYILDTSVPLTVNKSGYQIISAKLSQSYNQQSLSQLNLNRLVTRILIRSYGTSLSRILNYQGITLPEAQKAFVDLKPVAVKMGLLDEDNNTFADSRFREANIFVPRANGDSYVSFQEGSDLVGMIWSGVNLDSALKKDLIRICLNGQTNTTSATTVGLSCLLKVYHQQMPLYMTSLPEYLSYMRNTGGAEWSEYFNNVLKAAGYIPNSRNVAKLGDIALVPHVVQYIEMLYAKYDRDKNGYLDAGEALKAFPVFQPLIKQFAGGAVKDQDLDSVFTYILRYGKPPTTLVEKMKFLLTWKGHPEKWDVWADRTQLAKILGYIADQVTAASLTDADHPENAVRMPNMDDANAEIQRGGGR